MFYSHQLLARKAPLGQIWMAATMHAKLNRRKLDKLNIIKICEEILNPSVPMALRLSGILMGGVVIVYNKKVKFLYDDVNSLLVEINEAWRVKKPKKTKNDAVTIPTNNVVEMDIDQSIPMTNTTATARARFRNQDSRMQLDELEDEYIQINYNDSSPSTHQHHQADPQNITIMDETDLFLPTENDLYNRFETFDIFGDDEEIQITQDGRRDAFTINPTPPSQKDDELFPDHQMEEPQKDQMANESKSEAQESQDAQKNEQKQRLGPQRENRKVNTFIMDSDHLILPGSVYQTWIQDTSDILKNKRRKIKQPNPILAGKIANIMEIPPTILHLYIENFPSEICYPAPLIEQWIEITKPDVDSNSSSGERMDRQEQDPTAHSPPLNFHQDYPEFPGENFNTDIGFTSLPENMRELNFEKDSVFNTGNSVKSTVDASNPKVRSGPSTLPMFSPSNFNSGRSSKKNQYSSSGNSLSNLDPLEDDFPTFLETVPEDTDFELREEVGTTTQTPHVVTMDKPIDVITQHFKTHLKTHFMKEGAPLSESLDWLSSGLNRRSAAQLFYQTCVLANADYINVNQEVAYGEIFISRGPKM